MDIANDCKKKHNILIVHNYYQIPGGEDTVVANEKKMLEEHGYNVVFYSKNNADLKTMSKFKKLFLPINTIFNFSTNWEIRKIIKKEKIDVVHVHNVLNLISPSVYYAARKCRVPVVQTIHNFRLLCPGATFFRDGHICEECVRKGLHCAVKHKCYRNSKIQTLACVMSTRFHRFTGIYKKINYICLTEFNKEKLLSLKQIKKEQIFVKPNFVISTQDVMTFQERNDQYIYAGRLDKLKGIPILLEAWKIMGSEAPKLMICGVGEMEDLCREYIEKYHINAEMKGFVPNEEVKKLIGQSRGLILPTQWYEGFPMSMVESFSVGTPVFCSDLGNAGSIVKEGVNGYKFAPDDPADIVNAIKNGQDICRSTYQYYCDNYSEESNFIMLRDIYDSLCG